MKWIGVFGSVVLFAAGAYGVSGVPLMAGNPIAVKSAAVEPQTQEPTFAEVTGTVLKVDAVERTLQVRRDSGETMKVYASVSVPVRSRENYPVQLNNLTADSKVRIRYNENSLNATAISEL